MPKNFTIFVQLIYILFFPPNLLGIHFIENKKDQILSYPRTLMMFYVIKVGIFTLVSWCQHNIYAYTTPVSFTKFLVASTFCYITFVQPIPTPKNATLPPVWTPMNFMDNFHVSFIWHQKSRSIIIFDFSSNGIHLYYFWFMVEIYIKKK